MARNAAPDKDSQMWNRWIERRRVEFDGVIEARRTGGIEAGAARVATARS